MGGHRGSALLGISSDDQGRNGCCNIAHQMTRVGHVAGLSAIGFQRKPVSKFQMFPYKSLFPRVWSLEVEAAFLV